MISADQARQQVLDSAPLFPAECVPIDQAIGRVLRTPVRAERDLPPFDRVTMDGIAISFATWQGGARRYPVQTVQAAGDRPVSLDDPGNTIQVMTGTGAGWGDPMQRPLEKVKQDLKGGYITLEQANKYYGLDERSQGD